MLKKQIYLDHGASTPVDDRVVAAMAPYWSEIYGNPAAAHQYGRSAQRALADARRSIAGLLRAQPDEIVFTGGGSASDNLALRGVMLAARRSGRGRHLITSTVEHPAVLATARQLQELFGFALTVVAVDEYGRVAPAEVGAAIRPDTALISIMAANNEVGTLQPIAEIGQLARDHGVLFHTDAIQAAVSTNWNMSEMPIDLLSIAPHKFYGPKGIGILYVRSGVELIPVITGGDQENGRRAGTVNVPMAVGAAAALRLALQEADEHLAHCRRLRDRLIDGLLNAFPEQCRLTGHPDQRLPHNASFAFRHLNANDLLMHLDIAGIAASSGSACKTGNPKPSPVLEAMGLDESWTTGGLRLTVGKQNVDEEISYTLDVLGRVVPKLYALKNVNRDR